MTLKHSRHTEHSSQAILDRREQSRNLAPSTIQVASQSGPADGPHNFLTFDIEEWYHVNYEGIDTACYPNSLTNLESLVDRLLRLCDDAGVQATFFVLGSVAEKYPGMVGHIHAAGHEVASHGYNHKSLREMGPSEFEQDLKRSCGILESKAGARVIGFRAPSLSVSRPMLSWYYDVLERSGLRYSSSVFPGRTFLYGIPDFPSHVHRPIVDEQKVRIVEFPLTCVRIMGRALGLYLRLFPAPYLRRRIRAANAAGQHAMLYLHPREIDPCQPRLDLSWPYSVIHYFGIQGCERKLRRLLTSIPARFSKMGDVAAQI